MRRVAREEHPPRTVGAGHDAVPAPGLRCEDLHVDRRTDGLAYPGDRVIGVGLLVQVDREAPLVHTVDHRDVRPARRRQGVDLHRGAVQPLPQQAEQLGRTEVHSEVVALREHALELDAELPTDAAAASVAGHQVRVGQLLGGTARHVAHHGQDTLGVLLHRLQAGAVPDLDSWQFTRRACEQRHEGELGQEGGTLRRQRGVHARRPVGDPVVELGEDAPRCGGGEHRTVRVVRGRCRLRACLFRATPAPKVFHGARKDRLACWKGHAAVALIDHGDRYTTPPQLGREGQAHRPRSHDQDAPRSGSLVLVRHQRSAFLSKGRTAHDPNS